jgi:hypothetical protein
VWEGGVGYVFPDPSPAPDRGCASAGGKGDATRLHVRAGERTGSWSSVGAHDGNVTANLFALWVEHTAASAYAGSTTCFVTVPGVALEDFSGGALGFVYNNTVVANAPTAQAVLSSARAAGQPPAAQGVLAAAVYDAAGAALDAGRGWNVTFSASGAFLVTADAAAVALTAANPPQGAAWPGGATSVAASIDRALAAGGGAGADACAAGGSIVLAAPPSNGSSHSFACTLA